MKTIYKAIFLLVMVNGLIFISQGCWNRCGKDYDYVINSIQGSAVIAYVDSSNISYIRYNTKAYRGEPIRYDSIGFNLKPTYIRITQNTFEKIGFGSVMACQAYIVNEKIYSIKITSNKNYNAQYPAGTDLTDMIIICDDYNLKGRPLNTLQNLDGGSSYLLKPILPPANTDTYDFTLTFNLEKGGTIVTQINNVFITK